MGSKSTKPEVKKESPVKVDHDVNAVRSIPNQNGYYTTRTETTNKMFNPYKLEEPAAAASARSSGYSSGTSVEFMRTAQKPSVTTPTSPVTKFVPDYSRPPPNMTAGSTTAGTSQASGPSTYGLYTWPSTFEKPVEVKPAPKTPQPAVKVTVTETDERTPKPRGTTPTSNSGSDFSKTMNNLIDSFSSHKLDDVPGTEAVIVGRLRDGSRIVQTLPKTGMSEWLVLDSKSKNIAVDVSYLILPEIQAFIKVTKMGVNPPEQQPKFKYHVDEYFLQEIYNEPIGVELVAAVDTAPGVVTVVGNSFVKPTIVPWEHPDKAVKGGDFLIGNVHRLKPFFSSTNLHGVVCYVKNLEEERKYLEAVQKHKKLAQLCPPPRDPAKMYYMTGVRQLFKQEYNKIATNCRYMNVVSLEDANLYIRDVYIAIARLEKFTRLKSIEEHTLLVEGETTVDRSGAHERLALTVRLSSDDVQRVITDKSQDTWRIGTDLSIRHPELERHIVKNDTADQKSYEGGMTIEKIVHDKATNGCTVRFRPHPRSFDLFDVVAKTHTDLKGAFTIGPSDDYIETIVETLQSHYFADFVNNRRELFDSWRGVKKNEKTVITNLNAPFDINGDQLDDSQQIALRTAIGNPGFTCIEAPPGSGKTFLIAAMVAAKYQHNTPGVICISATTNNAISNAIDKTHECYAMIKKTREYSKKMEEEINEKSKKISLRQMALKAEDHIEIGKHQDVSRSLESYKTCKTALRTVKNKEEGLAILDDLQTADYMLRQSFLEAYRPYVTGSTCELVARRGDYIFKKIDKTEGKEQKEKLKESAITHLILDEASQLPPHLALAVYIMLPGLQKVTLIGDSEQLGPYTPLDEKTFVYRMVGPGELSRVGGHDSVERVHLRKVYRSHPKIVDLLLSPIYGPELKSGLTEDDRDLAKVKELPVATDGSPALFVNIENAKNDKSGVNKKELEVVLDFIQVLKKKDVTGTDVAVVCNHHAQRQAIMDALKGKGNIGVLNTSVAVHTVDSFQGKEAKVVLLLTTKVSTSSCPNHTRFALQFVANPNRGCVAVSRGQHAVYLFGDWFSLVKTKFWSKFVPGVIKSEAMVDAEWKPSSVDDYIKLKSFAQAAPETIANVGYGGRGTYKNTVHYNRGRAGHRGHQGHGNHVGHMGHVPHEHKRKPPTAAEDASKNDNAHQKNNQRGGKPTRRGGRGKRGQNGGAAQNGRVGPSQPVVVT